MNHSFSWRINATGVLVFFLEGNCDIVRVSAYGTPANIADGYLRMAKDTTIKCPKMFTNVVVRVHGVRYF